MHIKTSTEISAATASRRTGRGARIAGLTSREAEVLRLLHANRNKLNTPYTKGETEPGWCRPQDLGGTQQSHHSNTLGRLNRLGYVVKKPYSFATTHSSIYRISEAGIAAWDIYAEHQRRQEYSALSSLTPVQRQQACE